MNYFHTSSKLLGIQLGVFIQMTSDVMQVTVHTPHLTFPEYGSILAMHSVIQTLAQISLLMYSSCKNKSILH